MAQMPRYKIQLKSFDSFFFVSYFRFRERERRRDAADRCVWLMCVSGELRGLFHNYDIYEQTLGTRQAFDIFKYTLRFIV